MVERIATAIITVSSALLFGYWLRSAVLLLRGQHTPPEAFSTLARQDLPLRPVQPIASSVRIS